MKKIEQIRTNYDIITEKKDADTRKLDALARSGLFESKKIPVLKRALEKEPENMTIAERKVVVELLDSLISEAVYSQTINEARKEPNTSGQYLTKYDPRFDNSAAVSERDLPTIIILKRKGIRVFGSNQKIGLYYSQYLDRYISIPFGQGVPSINEAVDYQKAYQDYVKDYGDDDDKKKMPKSPDDLKKFVVQKAGEGKIRAKHYSVFSKNDGAERKELKKASNQYLKDKFLSGQISGLDALSAKAGVALGAAVRRGVTEPIRDTIRKIRGKTKTAEPTVAEPQAAPTVSAPKTLTKKQQAVKADVSARMASAKKSGEKAKDVSMPEKTRKMAANRARKVATYAQIDKRKAGLMEKIGEVRARNNQLNEFAPFVVTGARLGTTLLGKVLARAPKKAPPTPKPVEVPPVKTPPAKPIETPPAKPVQTPPAKPVETPPAKPVETPPARPVETPPAKPVETPPARPVETPPARPVETPPAKPVEAPPKPAETKPVETPAQTTRAKPNEKTPDPKSGATAPKRPGQGRRSLGRRLGLDLEPPASSSSKEDSAKYLDPAKFGLKITTRKPEAQVTTGVDKRQSNLYRKALETPVSEEKEEAIAHLKPTKFSMRVNTSAPKSKVRTGVEARMQKYERDYYTQQNENVIQTMKKMVSEDITEMQLNIGESPVTINNTIAQKIISVHESLNGNNKKQMEKMLSESVESFKKIVNFAVRQ
jgi:hypothetical protein